MVTIPTPLQMQADKRAGKIITITVPDGRPFRLSEYIRSWKKLLTLDSSTEVANWEWYPVSAGEILYKIRQGIHDRINRKACDFRPDFDLAGKHWNRVQRKLENLYLQGHIIHECNWCGSKLPSFTRAKHERFCDSSCRHSYNS